MEENKIQLTQKDLNKTFLMWWLTTELSNSYDRLQGLAFCNALSKTLKKLYKDDEEGYKEALVRHMEFYNSEGITGSLIHGISLSMEEEKVNGVDIPGEVITGIKTGLMGPIAGIGDTLIHGTLKPIILALACTFAMQGSPLGAFIPFLIPIICFSLGLFFIRFGYKLGKDSVMRLMKSGMINNIITGASIMGLFMMGALSSSYVKIATPLKFTMKNANPIVVQTILDQVLKGILPLCAIFGIYWYFTHKGANYNKVIFGILIISMIAGFLGILG
ncbi:MAG: PTS system mannose/fructose/sorbose family transporter subunit IID [Erysipelotrichaceae bacterium]